jgi:predicted HTH domain antitoxin
LFISSETEDADLFLIVRVFHPDLEEVVFQGALDPHTPIAQGWLRASHRKLDEDKSTVIRKALREGLHDLRVQVAIQRYQSGEISVNQAARVAGVSLSEWFEIARENNLTTQLTPEDFESDVDAAREL